MQLLEVTLRLQRFEVADESDESSDEELVASFEPDASDEAAKTSPVGPDFTAPVELVDDEPANEEVLDDEEAEEAQATSWATQPVEVIDLEDDRAEESSR